MENTAKAGFVLGNDGRVLVQLPADNQFGFVLADEESTWAGGIGSGLETWKLADKSQVSKDDIERLGWLLEDADTEPVRFTYEVAGSLSLFGQDAAYAVCAILEKRRAKDGKLTQEILEAAAKFLNADYETESEDGWTAESLAAAVKDCTFGRWDRVNNGMSCNHENVSHATTSSWESVCADCGEVIDRVQTNQ